MLAGSTGWRVAVDGLERTVQTVLSPFDTHAAVKMLTAAGAAARAGGDPLPGRDGNRGLLFLLHAVVVLTKVQFDAAIAARSVLALPCDSMLSLDIVALGAVRVVVVDVGHIRGVPRLCFHWFVLF